MRFPAARYLVPCIALLYLLLVGLQNLPQLGLGTLIDEALIVLGLLLGCALLYLWVDREALRRTLVRALAEKRGLEEIVARKATLETHLELTSAVRELALASAASHNLEEVLTACARILQDLVDRPGAELAIYLPSPRGGRPLLRLLARDDLVAVGRRARPRDQLTSIQEGRLAEALEGHSLSRRHDTDRVSLLVSLDGDTSCVGALLVSIPVVPEEADLLLDRLEPTLQGIARHVALALYKVTLYDEATLDGLTGLYTKRQYQQRVPDLIEEARRRQGSLSLMVIDLDHFKQVNDSHGHAAGDQVLSRIAEVIRRTIRTSDLAIRFGGEEILVVTPQDLGGAAVLAERIRERILGTVVRTQAGEELSLTASLGVAALVGAQVTARELFERADSAVYESKHRGRNRTSLWTPTGIVAAADSGLLEGSTGARASA